MRALLLIPWGCGLILAQEKILIPMDASQTDHLRAYGVAYRTLARGVTVEWLLNWEGGSFMCDHNKATAAECDSLGVLYRVISPSEASSIHARIEEANANAVLLEKAPRVAVYIPPYEEPWDDAVSLALEYAGIPYDRIWDREVLSGQLRKYDWLHLHHEDFTGQYGKFYGSYRNAPWYLQQVEINEAIAKELGYPNVPEEKKAVARAIREYVSGGGFLFAMCSGPITMDIALAAEGIDITEEVYDGDPPDPDFQSRLDFTKAMALKDARLITSPYIYEHSDVDVTREASLRGENTYFSLFEFSAKFDPVPTMLTQDHTGVVKEFMGQDTGFRKDNLKPEVVIMGQVEGTEEAKYIYGAYGKGFFSFLGGHDPEDYQHMVGDPPTDLRLHRNSPGYRLILNNVLFPAAKREKLKTSAPGWGFALVGGPRYTTAAGHESPGLSWEISALGLMGISAGLTSGLGFGLSWFDSRSGDLPNGGCGEGYLGKGFNGRLTLIWDPMAERISQTIRPRLTAEAILFGIHYRYEERGAGGTRVSPYTWRVLPVIQMSAGATLGPHLQIDLSVATGAAAPGVHPGETIGYPAYPWSFALTSRLWSQKRA
ncbi:MAG: hypothetical protein ABIM88_06340 [candidate division WOR-3 bacterium]